MWMNSHQNPKMITRENSSKITFSLKVTGTERGNSGVEDDYLYSFSILLYFLCKVVGKVAFFLKKANVLRKSQTCIAHGLCLMFHLVIKLHPTSWPQ